MNKSRYSYKVTKNVAKKVASSVPKYNFEGWKDGKPPVGTWDDTPIHRYGGIAVGEGGAYTWTPEDAIATELDIFKGRDIMPRRDIPSPEELVFQEILKNNPEYKELVKKKAKENRWFGRYRSKIDLEKDLKKREEDIKESVAPMQKKPIGKTLSKLSKLSVKQAQEAKEIAMESAGKPDTHIYQSKSGEEWEVNQAEYDYLMQTDRPSREREEVIKTIGAGTISKKTGRRRFFIISGTALAVIAGVGAVAGVASGMSKRKKQRDALKTQKEGLGEQIAEVRAEKKKYGRQMGQDVQSIAAYNKARKAAEFDEFLASAEKNIVPQGAVVDRQKGLQTGVAGQQEEIVTSALDKTAATKNTLSVMAQDESAKKVARGFDELKSSSDKIVASLRRGQDAVQTQIDSTKGFMNYFTDAVGGASSFLNIASSLGGNRNTTS